MHHPATVFYLLRKGPDRTPLYPLSVTSGEKRAQRRFYNWKTLSPWRDLCSQSLATSGLQLNQMSNIPGCSPQKCMTNIEYKLGPDSTASDYEAQITQRPFTTIKGPALGR